jgi:AmiR/NasT family two-component response regulator
MRHDPSLQPRLSAFVACERDATGEALLRELQSRRGIVTHVWPPPDRFPYDVDVIVTDMIDGLGERLPWMPGESTATLMVLLPERGGFDRKQLLDCSPDAVLFRPFGAAEFATTLAVARNQHGYIRRLRTRIARLDENVKGIRDIERAKIILMTQRGMDEDGAYSFIRNQAMERRVTIVTLARAIVDSHELLK